MTNFKIPCYIPRQRKFSQLVVTVGGAKYIFCPTVDCPTAVILKKSLFRPRHKKRCYSDQYRDKRFPDQFIEILILTKNFAKIVKIVSLDPSRNCNSNRLLQYFTINMSLRHTIGIILLIYHQWHIKKQLNSKITELKQWKIIQTFYLSQISLN